MWYNLPRPRELILSRQLESVCQSSSTVRHNTLFVVLKWLTLHLGESLLYCVEKHGVTIVVGQTGCGKTTRAWDIVDHITKLTGHKNFPSIFLRRAGHLKAA